MNHSSFSKASAVFASLIVSGLLLVSPAAGQTNYYFDPAGSGGTGSGGSGTWDTGVTPDWLAPTVGTGDMVFPAYTGSNGPGIANFDNAGGNVDVTAPVSPYLINVNVTDGTTENIGTGTPDNTSTANQITINVGNNVNLNPLNINSQSAPGTENVVFNSNLNLNVTQPYYSGLGFNSYSSGNLEFNGGITFSNSTTDGDDTGIPSVAFTENAGGSVTINSEVNAVNLPGSVPEHNVVAFRLNSAGSTMTLTKNASFVNTIVGADAGTVLDQGASFSGNVGYAINVSGTGEYLTDVAGMNVTAGVEFGSTNGGGGTIGGALAAVTTFSAPEIVAYSGANLDLTSAAGGRVNFTGDVHNGNGLSIVKVGAGTINMDDTGYRASDQTGAWEIKNGTMLLDGNVSNNTAITGSGLEIDNVANSSLSPNVQTYATLGGNGSTAVAVTADGANSSITPGDPTVNGGIGTLTLGGVVTSYVNNAPVYTPSGGLTAIHGLTMNFTLDGMGPNSEISLDGRDLSLAGTITFNFTNIGGALAIGNPYTLITDIGNGGGFGTALNDPHNTFVFNAPAGYTVSTYSTGGDKNDDGTSFYVEFEAAPEPSVYGMLGLGLLALIGIRRFRLLS